MAANGILTSLSLSVHIAITPEPSVLFHWLTKSIKWDTLDFTEVVNTVYDKGIIIPVLRYDFSILWMSSKYHII